VIAVLAVLLALIAAGCGAAPASRAAPALQVVTGLYPLAQAIEQIGGRTVAVTDVVPAGSDPRTYQLNAAQVAVVHRAAVAVEVDGFQPSFTAAAAGAHAVVDVAARLGSADPYVWLDPELMARAVSAIGAALAAANPPAAGAYRKNAQGFAAELKSTGIDYQSTLSTCPRRTIATADGAFADMARRYDLKDLIVGAAGDPAPTEVATAAGQVEAAGVTTVFAEPFVPSATVQAVASAAHAAVKHLDPLSGPPAGGWPHHPDYVQLLEENLGALSAALGCPNTETGM
jgi:zinc transport system substrate-binding protein